MYSFAVFNLPRLYELWITGPIRNHAGSHLTSTCCKMISVFFILNVRKFSPIQQAFLHMPNHRCQTPFACLLVSNHTYIEICRFLLINWTDFWFCILHRYLTEYWPKYNATLYVTVKNHSNISRYNITLHLYTAAIITVLTRWCRDWMAALFLDGIIYGFRLQISLKFAFKIRIYNIPAFVHWSTNLPYEGRRW